MENRPDRTPFNENEPGLKLEEVGLRLIVNEILSRWWRMANPEMALERLRDFHRLVPDILLITRGIEQFFIIPENVGRLMKHFEEELERAQKVVKDIEKALNHLGKLEICVMCGIPLTEENISRWEALNIPRRDHSIRFDSSGLAWCQSCTDNHDSIDWDKVAEERLGQ